MPKEQRIKLEKRLSQHNTSTGKVGVGLTHGNDLPSQTKDGDHVAAGKFRVLWYERRPIIDKQGKNTEKYRKYLKRKTIKLDSNRDQAEQIIEGITRFAGHVLKR